MSKVNKITKFDYFVVFSLVGIVPFLVYGMQYELPLKELDGSVTTYFDYFNLIKVTIIKGMAFLIAANYSLNFLTSLKKVYVIKEEIKEKFNKIHFFILIIILSTIIAFIFSEYKWVALFGAIQRFESIWVHFSYIVIFLYFMNFFKKYKSFELFSYAVLLSTFVVGFIGMLQFLGFNPFENEIVQNLTTPKSIGNFNVSTVGSYSTMYNINTSASYSVLMLHVLFIILVKNKNIVVKAITSVNLILIGITFYNSLSEAAYIAFAFSIFVAILLCVFLLLANKKYKAFGAVIVIGVVVMVGGITFISSNEIINAKIKNAVNSAIGTPTTFTDWSQEGNAVKFYNKDGNYIKIVTNENDFEVFEDIQSVFSNKYENGMKVTLETNHFEAVELIVYIDEESNRNIISFNDDFYIVSGNEVSLASKEGFRTLNHYDYFGFDGYGKLFTNRGYIWSRSLVMFFDKPFGYGSDTFFLNFPNDDDVGRAFNDQNEVVDKPHSIYLNMCINNGFLYLIGFLGIVFVVVHEKLKLLYKYEATNKITLIAYISGIGAYLVNGLATDNIVIIIMLFWVYLSFDNSIFEETIGKRK